MRVKETPEHLEHLNHIIGHAERAAASHKELADTHRKISKAHTALAKAQEDQGIAQVHRDIAGHHALAADAHESRSGDYQALAENLAGAGHADQVDEHSVAGDVVRDASRSDFVKMLVGE